MSILVVIHWCKSCECASCEEIETMHTFCDVRPEDCYEPSITPAVIDKAVKWAHSFIDGVYRIKKERNPDHDYTENIKMEKQWAERAIRERGYWNKWEAKEVEVN